MAKAMISMDLIGDRDLVRKFYALDRSLQNRVIKTGLKPAATMIMYEAKARAPVNTGALRDGIYMEYRRYKGRPEYHIKMPKRVDLAAKNPKFKVDDKWYYPSIVEYLHKSYLRSAFDAKRLTAAVMIAKAIRFTLRQGFKGRLSDTRGVGRIRRRRNAP